jgi:hypothetical protein
MGSRWTPSCAMKSSDTRIVHISFMRLSHSRQFTACVARGIRSGIMIFVAMICVMLPIATRAQAVSCASMKQVATDSAALAFENAWATAAAAHDTVALKCMLADGFVDTSWRGELRTRHDVLATGPAAPSGLHQHFSDWRVTRFGNTAIIRGLNTVTNASSQTVATLRFTDVLLYTSGKWQAVAAEETAIQHP